MFLLRGALSFSPRGAEHAERSIKDRWTIVPFVGPTTRNALFAHFELHLQARCRCMTGVHDGRELQDRRRRPRRPFVGTPPRQPRPRGAWDTSGQAPGPSMSTMN